MSAYRLSGEADRNIEEIIRFTVDRWGWAQAERYLADLHAAFDLLAVPPEFGRRIDHFRASYRRFEHGSHSVLHRGGGRSHDHPGPAPTHAARGPRLRPASIGREMA